MSFDLSDYVDVAERIRLFAEKWPNGSLQGDGYFVRDSEEKLIGYHYQAQAYRTPDDPRPGVGTAYEPIPGKTPYTRDSEVQNAETAAWGRAIVALGFETKKIASANEVRARQSDGGARVEPTPTTGSPPATTVAASPPSGTFTPPPAVTEELAAKQASSVPNQTSSSPEEMTLPFGKFSGRKLGDLVVGNAKEKGYVEWLAGEKFDAGTPEKRLLKGAAQTLLGQPLNVGAFTQPADDSDGIPF